MAIFDPINQANGDFTRAFKATIRTGVVYWERNLTDWTTRVALRGGATPGRYPLVVFHVDGTHEEHDTLPIRFDVHEHGRSCIYTRTNNLWWTAELQHAHAVDVDPRFRTLLLII